MITILRFHLATLARALTIGALTTVWFLRASYTTPHSLKAMLTYHRDQLTRRIEELP